MQHLIQVVVDPIIVLAIALEDKAACGVRHEILLHVLPGIVSIKVEHLGAVILGLVRRNID